MDNSTQQPPPSAISGTSNVPAAFDSGENPQEQSAKSFYGKRNWKKWVLVYLLIGALIYAGIYYFVLSKQGLNPYSVPPTSAPQPTSVQDARREPTGSAETANWKTYTGQLFSFQYPSDWTLRVNNELIVMEKEQYFEKQGPYDAQTMKVRINVSAKDVQPNTTLDEWLEENYLRGGDKQLFELTKQTAKKTMLGGTNAVAVIVPGAAGYLDEGVIAVHKSKGYKIHIIGAEAITGSREAYNQILSTFKFLPVSTTGGDQEQMIDTSNWKTYVDKDYGFTFQYPSFLLVREDDTVGKYGAPSIKQIQFYNPNNREKFDANAIYMNILRYDIIRAKDDVDLKNGFSEDAGGNRLKRTVIEKEIFVGDKKGSEFTINYADVETKELVFLEYEFLIPLNKKTLSIHLFTANNKAKKIIDEVIFPTFIFLE